MLTANAYLAALDDPKTQVQSGIIGEYDVKVATVALRLLTCDSFENLAEFCGREIDRQFQRSLALLETDQGAAARVWARMDRQLVDQAPWAPLYTPRTPYFVSKRVGNWQYHPSIHVLLDQLWVR